MANRSDRLLVGLGTGAVLLSALGAGLVLAGHRLKPQAARSSHTAPAATPSGSPLAIDSLLPSPLATLLPSPSGAPSLPPATHAPLPRRTPSPPPPPPFSGAWPDYRSGPDESGWNGAENRLDPAAARTLTKRWEFNAGAEPPVISGAYLYAARLAEVDAFPAGGCGQRSCDVVWRADLGMSSQGPTAPAGAPAVAGGWLLVTVNTPGNSGTAWVYAYKAAGCGSSTCSPVWKRQIGWDTSTSPGTNGLASSPPVASGGLVYAAPYTTGDLYALAADSGAVAWKATVNSGLRSAPAVANGVVYVMDGSTLTAYAASGCGAATCSPLWSDDIIWSGQSGPVVSNGRVFVEDGYSKVHAFDAQSGATLWTTPTDTSNTAHGSPLAAPNVVVVAGSNSLWMLDPTSGAVLWTVPVGASIASASPTGGDGVGYVLADNDVVWAFATAPCGVSTCAPIWSASAGAPNGGGSGYDGPVVAGGRLFVRGADGSGSCFEPS